MSGADPARLKLSPFIPCKSKGQVNRVGREGGLVVVHDWLKPERRNGVEFSDSKLDSNWMRIWGGGAIPLASYLRLN